MDSTIVYIFLKYLNDECTAQELEFVFSSLAQGTYQEEWKAALAKDEEDIIQGGSQSFLNDIEAEQIYAHIENTLKEIAAVPASHTERKRKTLPLWFRYMAAAVVILVCGINAYLYFSRPANENNKFKLAATIQPGRNRATLILADGSSISLTDADNNKLAKQAGVEIRKTQDGQLIYKAVDQAVGTVVAYNTVSTPKGGQYRVELPDGTGVWLNAASSIRFPVTFSNSAERRIQLTGEAYFEVAKDQAHPFIVSTNGQDVRVLGTHFIVNSYTDEPGTRTTLLEGAVQVSLPDKDFPVGQQKTVQLKPGQQAFLYHQSLKIGVADLEEAAAWKNGYFRFNDESLESIMRKLARWYDIDVIFQGYQDTGGFSGTISRYKTMQQVLIMLEKTKDIHFKIEGRRIIVMS